MGHVSAILFGALAAGVGLSLLFGIFGAVARVSAFSKGRPADGLQRQALTCGARSGLRFGLVCGLLGGGLAAYIAGPDVVQFGSLAKCFLAGVALIIVALFFGLQAGWREQAWKEGRYGDACPPF